MIRLLARLRRLFYSWLRVRTLGASVLAIDDDGKVLLVRHNYGPDVWLFPGGAVKRKESFKTAALREVGEELGVKLRADGTCELFGLYLLRRGNWQDYLALYVLRGWDLTPTSSWEIDRSGCFDLDALPPNTAQSIRRRLLEWEAKAPLSDEW